MIDLHTHSNASDGTVSPEALVALAARKGLSALALTDHDTVAGVPVALAQGRALGVEVVPGIELTTEWDGSHVLHILGYFLRHEDPALGERLAWLKAKRRERAGKIVARLSELGLGVTFEQLETIAGDAAMGRPHVARALVEAGAVRTIDDAFRRYLSHGRPGFVKRETVTTEEGIALLKAAGAITVLAHPGTYRLKARQLARLVEQLKAMGLEGLEVYWSGHGAAQVESYGALAQRLGLVVTGGSDFHGDAKPGIELGRGRADSIPIPDSVLAALRERQSVKTGH